MSNLNKDTHFIVFVPKNDASELDNIPEADEETKKECWAREFYPKEFEYIDKHNTFIPKTLWKSGDNGTEKNRLLIYNQPKFYGYYADYDWVLLCSLWGRMLDLPKGFPMYCKDLKQMLDETVSKLSNSDFFTKFHLTQEMTLEEKLKEIKKHIEYPRQENEHNALDDAQWNKNLFHFINKLQ